MSYLRKSLLTGLLVLAVVFGCTAFEVEGKQLSLVVNGHPKATIVVSENACDKVKTAAADLEKYIHKMSGVHLPITTDEKEPSGVLILVGKSRITDLMGVSIPSGLTSSRREEGFTIVCRQDRLVLAGNDEVPYHGTEYAVYELLNRLGVRWFMPDEFGEVVPSLSNISFPEVSLTQKPDFIMRNWWLHDTPEMRELLSRWKIRNKMNPDVNGIFVTPIDGSASNLIPDSLAKDHPEYFAQKADGTCNPHLPSFTHPKAVEISAETLKKYFRENPDANSFGFAPEDGLPRDFSPETMKLHAGFTVKGNRANIADDESSTEEWIQFANKVAAEVRKEFPDVYICTNGYANRTNPPHGVKPNDHLVIMFADIMYCQFHSHDNPRCWMSVREGQMLKRWCELSDNVWTYGYEPMLVSATVVLPDARKISRDMPLRKKWGSIGFYDESRNAWAEYSVLGRYTRARMSWDVGLDPNKLWDDFYTGWYGKAAGPMKTYYTLLEDAIEKYTGHGHEDRVMVGLYPPKFVQSLEKHIVQAEKLAETDSVKTRIRAERLIYEHLRAYVSMLQAQASADFSAAAGFAGRMLQIRKDLNSISPFYIPANERHEDGSVDYKCGAWYWAITDRQEFFRRVADRMNGVSGELICLLPEIARFGTDPKDEGIFAGWYSPGFDDSRWDRISVTKPMYLQGYIDETGFPYDGYMWYRLNVDVPATADGKRIMIYVPEVEDSAWLWVNGQYIGRRAFKYSYERPCEMEFDVTDAIIPGKTNTIAIRGTTSFAPGSPPGGLVSRVFLYSPK